MTINKAIVDSSRVCFFVACGATTLLFELELGDSLRDIQRVRAATVLFKVQTDNMDTVFRDHRCDNHRSVKRPWYVQSYPSIGAECGPMMDL